MAAKEPGELWRASREWLGDKPPAWETPPMTWEKARSALRAELAEFRDEQDCPHCIGQADTAIAVLDGLPDSAPFREDVDGSDYVLAPVPAS